MRLKMHFGASPAIFQTAAYLRNHPTPAEEILWNELRKNKLGYRFRRQHPLKIYVVDFYCHLLKFAIELDGSIHELKDQKIIDIEKQTGLHQLGIHLLRISNAEILHDLPKVMDKIYAVIHEIKHSTITYEPKLFK